MCDLEHGVADSSWRPRFLFEPELALNTEGGACSPPATKEPIFLSPVLDCVSQRLVWELRHGRKPAFSSSPALLITGRELGWCGRVSGSEMETAESVLCGISSEGLVRAMRLCYIVVVPQNSILHTSKGEKMHMFV